MTSGVTDGGQDSKLNVKKTGPHLAYVLIFSILLILSRLLFFLRFFS